MVKPPTSLIKNRKVRSLTFSKKSGEPYARRKDVEAQIAEVIQIPASQWPEMASSKRHGRLLDETLVYLLRESLQETPAVLGAIVNELARRVVRHGSRWARGFEQADTDALLEEVAAQIVDEVTLKNPPSRTGEFLEIALSDQVKNKTLNAVDKLKRRPQGHREHPVQACFEEETTVVPTVDMIADNAPEVLDLLVEQEAELERRALVRKALGKITNPRHREAVILRYIQNWPVVSQDKKKPSLTRHFRLTSRQLTNWFDDAFEEMRAAVGAQP